MQRILTIIRLPHSQDAGIGEDGSVSVEEAIAAYRSWAATKLIEAIEVLDAPDEAFRVTVERGVHRPTTLAILQEGDQA